MRRRFFFLATLFLIQSNMACAAPEALPQRLFAAYHESWSEPPTEEPTATRLARLPGSIDLVMLAFAKPDMMYDGGLDLRRSGLGFPFNGQVLSDAVSALRKRHPRIHVLLSVGGATYQNWEALNPAAIARLVTDLGLDGVDIDFEPEFPDCHLIAARIRCSSDLRLTTIITELRRLLPRPRLLSVASWSVGAFGEGAWRTAQPVSRYTGLALTLLRSSASQDIDVLSVMAYDGGPKLDPLQAFEAYRQHFQGRLLLGLAVQDNAARPWPEHLRRAEALARSLREREGLNGMMLYSLQMNSPADQPNHPAAAMLALAICQGLGRSGCEEPLP